MNRFERVFARVSQHTDYERMSHGDRPRFARTLDGVRLLVERLGNPQNDFLALHVAGTKGKGSTAEMLAAMLTAHGESVGLYTSPHLVTIRERIRVDGVPIGEDALADVLEEVLAALEAGSHDPAPTFFDIMTAAAFVHFRRCDVDWAVIEVGLGGRLDSTNIISPAGGVLTGISLDHTGALGGDLASIAGEKAGIIKPGMAFACNLSAGAEVELVVRQVCDSCGVDAAVFGRDCVVESSSGERFDIVVDDTRYRDLELGTPGRHQRENAALAVAVLHRLARQGTLARFDERLIRRALGDVRVAGRGERVADTPPVLLDGAHNPASAAALRRLLDERYGEARRHFVISIAADKDWRGFLRNLLRREDRLYATVTDNPRVLEPRLLVEEARRLGCDGRAYAGASLALEAARLAASGAGADPEEMVCVTGSFYLVGELRDGLA